MDIEFTRVSGKRVTREQTRSWAVPYCVRCLDHMEAAKELDRFRVTIWPLAPMLWSFSAVAILAQYVLISKLAAFPAVVLGVVWTAAVGVVVYWLTPLCLRADREARTRRDVQRRQLRTELDRCLGDDCADTRDVAAEYDGWYGSVHTFYFASRNFAHAFRRENAGKIVG